MAKFKTSGQKRKSLVRALCISLFLISTTIVCFGFVSFMGDDFNRGWKESYTAAEATVVNKELTEEEYSGRKGRTKTRDVYTLDYTFENQGEVAEGSARISESDYLSYSVGDTLAIGYDKEDPFTNNDTVASIQTDLNRSIYVDLLIKVAPVSAGICYFLYLILGLVFVRESKDAMPQGFFTENSWLDVDDGYHVALENGELISFKIDKKCIGAVQDSYQDGESTQALIDAGKASKLIRIPLSEVNGLESEYNSDVLNIRHGENNHTIEFLNRAVKAHALEAIKKYIPDTMTHSNEQKARIKAAMPSLVVMGLMIMAIVYFNDLTLGLILGAFAMFMILPKLVTHLSNPYIVDSWQAPQV